MRYLGYILGGVLALFILLWNFVFFTVDQTQQALVIQFGQPQRVVTEPGLNVMIPFAQSVVFFEKRVLALDAPTEEVTSSDQKRLVVDAFARYRRRVAVRLARADELDEEALLAVQRPAHDPHTLDRTRQRMCQWPACIGWPR